jgi:redox-sensitive bicupin YhaK (pirin superfamily)
MNMSRAAATTIHFPNARAAARRIVRQVRGHRGGPINRLMSPSDIGQLIKPFVFLDYGVMPFSGEAFAGIHPHSGIATLSLPIRGGLVYEDTTGKSGEVLSGGLEWMKAGGGVWHDGRVSAPGPLQFYQLWVALPESEENAPAESQYISPTEVEQDGPARVLLGRLGNATSRIRAPRGMNYLQVELKSGELWRYEPPAGHTVAWVSVYEGELHTPAIVLSETLAVFEESDAAIEFVANGDTSFVLGSAIKHPHDLVTGYYSVHTSAHALERGEAEIRRIGKRLHAAGRLQRAIAL